MTYLQIYLLGPADLDWSGRYLQLQPDIEAGPATSS